MKTQTQGVIDSHNSISGKLVFVTLLLAVILALSACGNETADSTDISSPVAADNAPVDTQETEAEPTAETAEVVAPTELPPTEAPATDVPPTEAPATEPPPTDEPPAEAGLDLPEGLCANPYFPVIEGRRYTYQSDVPGIGPSTITFAFSDVTPSSFQMNLVSEDESFITYTWQCFEDGILSPSAQLNTGIDMTIETIEASGLTFPNPEDVSVGQTWTTHYVLEAEVPDTGAGPMMMQQTIDLNNEIVAIEPVSVAFGDFDEAVKVQTMGTISMVTSMGETELPGMTIDMSSNTWYVENVGRVRSEDFNDFFGSGETEPVVTELIAIE